MKRGIEPRLKDWTDVERTEDWKGILLGNGASLAVWDGFGYASLYEIARKTNEKSRLNTQDESLFQSFLTKDFESVMLALRTTEVVGDCIGGVDTEGIRQVYERLRLALVEAVTGTHVKWSAIPKDTLLSIRQELRNYEFVYSTNYDLLVYWAIMVADPSPDFTDCFLRKRNGWVAFDPFNTNISALLRKILYLHGGLHLYQSVRGEPIKRVVGDEARLLDAFAGPSATFEGQVAVPLFVTEGDGVVKLSSIGDSPYLSFAYQRLLVHPGPLVIFGHSLGQADLHLVQAIRGLGDIPIAVSIRLGSAAQLKARVAGYGKLLPEAELTFFDAETHPLGGSALKVQQAAVAP